MPRVARIVVPDRPHRNIGDGPGVFRASASGTEAETHAEISIMSPEPVKTIVMIMSCLGVAGCQSTEGQLVSKGTYGAPNGEYVVVEDRTITFHLAIADGGHTRVIDKTCNYYLRGDGTIVPYTLASTEYFIGIGRYRWVFRKGMILKLDIKTGETVSRFSMQSPATPG
jgi:hypothetical protein